MYASALTFSESRQVGIPVGTLLTGLAVIGVRRCQARINAPGIFFFIYSLFIHSFIHCLTPLSSPSRHWLWCFSDIFLSFFGLDWLSLLSAATAWPAHDPCTDDPCTNDLCTNDPCALPCALALKQVRNMHEWPIEATEISNGEEEGRRRRRRRRGRERESERKVY